MTPERDIIALAEKVLAVLELGSFSATYEYALFTAILDLCIERSGPDGPPASLTTDELAGKVVELYWAHAVPFEGRRVLRQGGVRDGNQAEILTAIQAFRTRHAPDPDAPLFRASVQAPAAFRRLLDAVEWKLVEMPIPRLQVVGREEDRFLYEYGWEKDVRRGDVAAKQRGEASGFDNTLRFLPGVAEALVRLNGVLRPIVHREWTVKVAAMNGLPEARLEAFLFGSDRVPLAPVRGPLRDLQAGRCFYCGRALGEPGAVDHFIPWARYADNGIDNLVVAHERCNGQKRDFLAAAEHVERLVARNEGAGTELEAIAGEARWTRDAERSRSVRRALYVRLPVTARVWLRGQELVPFERGRVLGALG